LYQSINLQKKSPQITYIYQVNKNLLSRREFIITGIALGIYTCRTEKSLLTDNQRIAFIGDSITFQGGYVKNLQLELAKKGDFEVFNFGKSSETLSGLSEADHPFPRPVLFERLDNILSTTRPDITFLYYGINDGIYSPFDQKRFDAYKSGLDKAIKIIHESGSQLVLLTPSPYVGDNKVSNEGLPLDKYSYQNPYCHYNEEVISIYAEYILQLEDKRLSKIIDIYHPLLKNKATAFNSDPIHPNTIGHKIISDTIQQELNI
jgi:lysophospholipase L1-like esterase